MKRVLAIINPKSGTGSKGSIVQKLVEAFSGSDYTLYIAYTKYAGHAYELAQQAVKDRYERVVAVGGDGTVNEIAQGLIHTEVSLAIIPTGSGNGLARALDLPMDSGDAAVIAANGEVEIIDCCRANGRPFFCTCGMGFDAEVSAAFAEAPFRGFLSYAKTSIEHYIKYKPAVYRVEIEGKEPIESEAFVVAAANASQYGNNAHIAPRASMQDGLVDIVILQPFKVTELPNITFQLFSKKLEDNIRQQSYQTARATLIRKQAGVVHLDGEPMEMPERIEIEVVPSSIRVVRPTEPIKPKGIIEQINRMMSEQSNK